MTEIGKYIQMETKQMAIELMYNGVPDEFTRMITWLELLGYVNNNLQLTVAELHKFTGQYQQQRYRTFIDPKPRTIQVLEEQNALDHAVMKERIIAYVDSQPQLDSELEKEILKDVIRLQPNNSFYKQAEPRIAIFRLTYLLCCHFNVEHCQGFDDIAAVVYQVAYKAVMTLIESYRQREGYQQEPREIIEYFYDKTVSVIDNYDLVEGIAFVFYRHLINLIYHWYTGKHILKNRPNTPSADPFDISTISNLSNLVRQVLSQISHNTLQIIDQIREDNHLSFDIIVCRYARTLFSREFSFQALVKLWDFIFLNGYTGMQTYIQHTNQMPKPIKILKTVAEFSALYLHNLFAWLGDDERADVCKCETLLFSSRPVSSGDNEDAWRLYINELQYITQQTSECFEVPPYAKYQYDVQTTGLRLINKYFYLENVEKNSLFGSLNKQKQEMLSRQRWLQESDDIATLAMSSPHSARIFQQHEDEKIEIEQHICRKWQDLQVLQLDAGGLLNELHEQLELMVFKNKKPDSNIYSLMACLSYDVSLMEKYEPNLSFNTVQGLGNRFEYVYENELSCIGQQLQNLNQQIIRNSSAVQLVKVSQEIRTKVVDMDEYSE